MNSLAIFDGPTPVPLLEELAIAGSEAGWERFVFLYEPFLRGQLRRYGLQHCDEADLVQEVFAVVLRRLGEFRHNGKTGAFRAWLREIVVYTARHFFGQQRLRPALDADADDWSAELADDDSPLAADWDREHDLHVTARLLELVRAEFDETHYQAFRCTTLDEQPIAAVAEALGVTSNVIYIARSRVLARLRAIGRGLMPDG